MARGRPWPPEDVERGLLALAEAGDNAEEASRMSQIPANTLREWKSRYNDEFVELRREKRSDLIEDLWSAAREALRELRGNLSRMKGRELGIVLGILIDKALVMGGEPTEITKQLPQIVFRGIDESEYEDREQE
jgi:transposase-like protein